MEYSHKPVLLKEALELLAPKPGDNFIDCTLGGGGYTLAIARAIKPNGKVLSIDLDKRAIENIEKIKGDLNNLILVHDNFKNLLQIIQVHWPEKEKLFSGIVFDLGLSSDQLENRDRGFSFRLDAPLDMRFNNSEEKGTTAARIVNTYKEEILAKIIFEYGEERYARSIAKAIVIERRKKYIESTAQLVDIIGKAVPESYKKGKIHYATKTFQALRIEVNQELENIRTGLSSAIELIKPGGRVAVISFHSLEDRIVKEFFRKENKECICPPLAPVCVCGHEKKLKIITKKPIVPGVEEIGINPRSRSAKMRVAEKI